MSFIAVREGPIVDFPQTAAAGRSVRISSTPRARLSFLFLWLPPTGRHGVSPADRARYSLECASREPTDRSERAGHSSVRWPHHRFGAPPPVLRPTIVSVTQHLFAGAFRGSLDVVVRFCASFGLSRSDSRPVPQRGCRYVPLGGSCGSGLDRTRLDCSSASSHRFDVHIRLRVFCLPLFGVSPYSPVSLLSSLSPRPQSPSYPRSGTTPPRRGVAIAPLDRRNPPSRPRSLWLPDGALPSGCRCGKLHDAISKSLDPTARRCQRFCTRFTYCVVSCVTASSPSRN